MPEELQYMRPILPLLLEFGHKLLPIIFRGRQDSAEVLNWNGVAQRLDVGQEDCLRSGPCYFYGNSEPLFLCPMGGQNLCAGMAALQGLPRHELYLSCLLIFVTVTDFVIFFYSRPCKNVHVHLRWIIQQTTKDCHKLTILVCIISFNTILFNNF